MRKSALILVLVLATGLLSGCGAANKEGTGTLVGAVAGGVIGNQFGKGSGKVAATALGAVAGGILGNEIGHNLDEQDRQMAAQAQYRALEYGRPGYPTAWNDPSNNYHGSVEVGGYYNQGGYRCRRYTHTIWVEGQPQVATGTACRNPDGTWRTVS